MFLCLNYINLIRMGFQCLRRLIYAFNLLLFVNAAHTLIPEPNRRGVEMNRDFTNSFQYGFEQGLLKVSQSGTLDCVDSGMSLVR